jgi:hypothetical protein
MHCLNAFKINSPLRVVPRSPPTLSQRLDVVEALKFASIYVIKVLGQRYNEPEVALTDHAKVLFAPTAFQRCYASPHFPHSEPFKSSSMLNLPVSDAP